MDLMKPAQLTCGRARADQAERIVELIQQGFAPEFLSMTTMGCSGAAEYCRLQIQAQDRRSDSAYVVAMLDQQVVGGLELRVTVDTIFINYVAVSGEARGHGVASRLVREGVDMIRTPQHQWLRLDVLEDNTVARRWYEGLGFQVESTTDWHQLDCEGFANGPVYVGGHPQSEVMQAHFGFSQLSITTSLGAYTLGKLGRKWLRVTNPALVSDPDALGYIATDHPDRSVLVVAPRGAILPEYSTRTELRATTLRMSLGISKYDAMMNHRERTHRK
jgi:ribosomal protein S18 acetylase RimI-like enzyme